MLYRRRISAVAAVVGALALAGPVAGANAAALPAPIAFPGFMNLGPTGPMGPLGPHGPLGGSGQVPTGWNAWNLGPGGPLGPGGQLGGIGK